MSESCRVSRVVLVPPCLLLGGVLLVAVMFLPVGRGQDGCGCGWHGRVIVVVVGSARTASYVRVSIGQSQAAVLGRSHTQSYSKRLAPSSCGGTGHSGVH
jgi:hypothetical protein